jgi:hypothetical protein
MITGKNKTKETIGIINHLVDILYNKAKINILNNNKIALYFDNNANPQNIPVTYHKIGLSSSIAENKKYKSKTVNNINGISGVIINPKAFDGKLLKTNNVNQTKFILFLQQKFCNHSL